MGLNGVINSAPWLLVRQAGTGEPRLHYLHRLRSPDLLSDDRGSRTVSKRWKRSMPSFRNKEKDAQLRRTSFDAGPQNFPSGRVAFRCLALNLESGYATVKK